ncbi:MAG: hypothetical protein KA436_06585 [Oligoflexales bacterium]|nr:hypothetical protein [Oligoflexales bacterium]
MDIGFYHFKDPFRKFLKEIVPFCKNVNPNTISWAMLPVGALTGLAYIYAHSYPEFYLFAILLSFVRLVLATLDGLVAQTFKKENQIGEIINRFIPELCDIILMVSLVNSQSHFHFGLMALAVAWLSSYTGLVGLVAAKPIQSVGPVGQTDRLVTLMVFSLLEYFSLKLGWTINFITIFLYWTIFGGVLTIINRMARQY